jgi:hypothetical protein
MKKIFLLVMLIMFTMIPGCDKMVRSDDYYAGNTKTRVFHRKGCIYYNCYLSLYNTFQDEGRSD